MNVIESVSYSQFFLTLKHTNTPTATDGRIDIWIGGWMDGWMSR